MRLFTDGKQVVLRLSDAIVRWTRKSDPEVELRAPTASITTYQRDGILALSPSGRHDFTADAEALDAQEAVAFDEERVATLVVRDDRFALLLGAPGDDDPAEIPLDALNPKPIAWPDGVIWESAPKSAFSRAKGMGTHDAGVPTLSRNRFGLAVASKVTGVVAVVRPGAMKPTFAVRFPTQDEARIHAEPTERGVLVTLVIAGRESGILHVAEDGSVIGHVAAFGAAPALLLGDNVLVYDDAEHCLMVLDGKLKKRSTKPITFFPCEAVASADGSVFALANEADVLLGKVTRTGKVTIVEQTDHATAARTARRLRDMSSTKSRYDPQRAHGSPAVGFASGGQVAAWSANAGAPFTLQVPVRSSGGAGRGIAVTVSGPALGLAELGQIEVEALSAPLAAHGKAARRAELPHVVLAEGLELPLRPPPKGEEQQRIAGALLDTTQFTLRIHGKATRAGRELLTVEVAALDSKSAPMKWTRPLSVSA